MNRRERTTKTQHKQIIHKISTAPGRPTEIPPSPVGPKTPLQRQPHPKPRRGPRHTDTRTAQKTLTHPCTISQNTQIKIQKGGKAKTRTQQHTKPKAGAKINEQANPRRADNSQSTRPPPRHQQTNPKVGTTTESEARSTGAQLKRKARPDRSPSTQSAATPML